MPYVSIRASFGPTAELWARQDTFSRVLLTLKLLHNHLNSPLPSEIFSFPGEIPDPEVKKELESLGAKLRVVEDAVRDGKRTKVRLLIQREVNIGSEPPSIELPHVGRPPSGKAFETNTASQRTARRPQSFGRASDMSSTSTATTCRLPVLVL